MIDDPEEEAWRELEQKLNKSKNQIIEIKRFAELILEQERKEAAKHYLKLIRDCVATEREACAKLCEQLLAESESAYEETEFEKQLRLLSLKLVEIPTKTIAEAIRARGEK